MFHQSLSGQWTFRQQGADECSLPPSLLREAFAGQV
jgi:hypothetical protein